MIRKSYEYIIGIDSSKFGVSDSRYNLFSVTANATGATTYTAGSRPSIDIDKQLLMDDFSLPNFRDITSACTSVYLLQPIMIYQYTTNVLIHSEQNIIASVGTNSFTIGYDLKYAYTVGGVNEIRITASSVFYFIRYQAQAYPRLIEISTFGQSIDITRGGGIAENIGGFLTLQNTDRFNKYCEDNSIYLNGKSLKIWVLIGSKVATGENNFYILGTYECETPYWSVTQYTIPFRSNLLTRNVNITQKTNHTTHPNASNDQIGKAIPASFGNLIPSFNSDGSFDTNCVALGVRTSDKLEYKEFADVTSVGQNLTIEVAEPDDCNIKPLRIFTVGTSFTSVVGEMPKKHEILIGNSSHWYVSGSSITQNYDISDYFDDVYVHCIEGSGSGNYRRITKAEILENLHGNSGYLCLDLADYYKEMLQGTSGVGVGEVDNQSFVELVKINRQYTFDTWPCYGFLNESSQSISTNLELYVYDNDLKSTGSVDSSDEVTVYTNLREKKFLDFPSNALRIIDTSLNNQVDVDLKQYQDDIESSSSFKIIPVRSPKWCVHSTGKMQQDFGFDASIDYYSDGLYSDYPVPLQTNTVDFNSVITNNLVYGYKQFEMQGGHKYIIAINFKMPIIRDDFKFDNLFLGINGYCTVDDIYDTDYHFYNVKSQLLYRSDWGTNKSTLIHQSNGVLYQNASSYATAHVSDLPLFYYNGYGYTAGYSFYNSTHFISPGVLHICGYESFKFNEITTIEQFNKYRDFVFTFEIDAIGATLPGNNILCTFNLSNMALIFEKKVSIKEKVFSFLSGRIYNDTWDSRRTAADLIFTPLDIYEHACRLQRFQGDADYTNKNYGSSYANYPLIKLTGEGSFDASEDNLNATRTAIMIATQLLDYDKCYTDWIKKTICKNFNLIGYTDANGYECVKSIVRYGTTPSINLTLLDIIDRNSIKIIEPDPKNIFCQPFVRYNFNTATEDFEGFIEVTNVWHDSYVEGDVIGSPYASSLWTACHNLYLKIGVIEKPPSDFTDLYFACGRDGYIVARDYLYNWILSMDNPTISFKMHLSKCYTYQLGMRFTITLPHQTNNTITECILSKIIFKLEAPYDCELSATMLTSTSDPEYFINRVIVSPGTDSGDWDRTVVPGDVDIDRMYI